MADASESNRDESREGAIARWRDGRIVEEYLFYDSGTFMKQIGLS